MPDLLPLVAVPDELRVLRNKLLRFGFRGGVQAREVVDRLVQGVGFGEEGREVVDFASQATCAQERPGSDQSVRLSTSAAAAAVPSLTFRPLP